MGLKDFRKKYSASSQPTVATVTHRVNLARAIPRQGNSFAFNGYAAYRLAGYFEASGFEPVAFVLRAVLFAQVSAAVGTVLYCQYLAVGADYSPYKCHFCFISPGILSVLAMVTKAVWTFPTQKDK